MVSLQAKILTHELRKLLRQFNQLSYVLIRCWAAIIIGNSIIYLYKNES